ncbi:MAG: sulfatase-like hydrolase/transferase [Acidobacteria bacterium]|nr:sulfatase-like hydrolase/transferase [Acidobacteriota bacterium]
MKRFFLLLATLVACEFGIASAVAPARPNILWITCEDIGPQLGCYGDAFATTPNLDRLAARGMIYTRAWSCGPVCAPARTTIISGLYPPSLGAEHMRSLVPMPPWLRMYPQHLRAAGYYCTNNEKEDYNLVKPGRVWDESSRRAHWTNRPPDRPFFAVFNYTVTHESQIRKRPHTPVHDPAKVRVPAYHPDTPEIRQDWAQYYDQIAEMDALAGKSLRELADAGLAEDTIVFFYGDHGPGMPRCKRFPYNSGLQVPLIVYVPEKWRSLAPADYQPGGRSDRLVSFVDLAPTVLSLAGVKAPNTMQGVAFMGPYAAPAPAFNFGFRGRMDERYDLDRSVTDGRYVYLRNYLPHLPHGQHVAYMFETPTTQVWKRLFDEGKLPPAQAYFWQRKAPEELYDLQTDPDEVHNLAASPAHQEILARFRAVLHQHLLATRDLGFLPEAERERRRGSDAPYTFGHDPGRYPLERILEAAEAASANDPAASAKLEAWLNDSEPGVRYWAVMGYRIRGASAVKAARMNLSRLLQDESPSVRIAAAEALGQFGEASDLDAALKVLVELARLDAKHEFVAVEALNALDALGAKARPALPLVKQLPTSQPGIPARMKDYVPRLIRDILERD